MTIVSQFLTTQPHFFRRVAFRGASTARGTEKEAEKEKEREREGERERGGVKM